MQLFSAEAKIFSNKNSKFFFAPQNMKKNSHQKLLIIPLDHQFSVQQVFALWNWDSFKVWNFLSCQTLQDEKYLRISKMQVQ